MAMKNDKITLPLYYPMVTFMRGIKKIDSIWSTQDISINKGGFIPFPKKIDYHRTLVVYIPNNLIYDTNPPNVEPPKSILLDGIQI